MVNRSIILIIRLYAAIVAVWMIVKPIFMAVNHSIYSHTGATDWFNVVKAGFAMDCSMAAYLMIVPCLLMIAAQWIAHPKVVSTIFKSYLAVISFLIAATVIVDTMLYPYWGFKLDTTPLFYFSSSPKLAFASVTGWQIAGGTIALILLTVGIAYWLIFATGKIPVAGTQDKKSRIVSTACLVVLTGFLFIPMRGGFTVATMNLSSAYYTNDTKLNHAAVNPMFSLMYSMAHADNAKNQFRFFDDERAEELFADLNKPVVADSNFVAISPLKNSRPDIYLIILESFSNHLFKSLGGEDIATGLDSIANNNSLFFDNFYASSFRTDRGIPAILSGYPGQPTTSIMKSVARAASLPSIASMLGNEGYSTHYYYGGDLNFTNMKAYLASTGYNTIVGDTDFPIGKRLSKWGVHDGPLFDKVISELTPFNADKPRFITIQTSSSHEPFDVDRTPRSADEPKQVTAFAYTDSCVTSFINRLHLTDNWSNSILILVPDHYGAYPTGLGNLKAERQIPLIITGGALNIAGRNHSIGSQTDIAATLAGMLNVDSSQFKFSHNLLDPASPQYAFFSSKGQIGLITPDGETIYDLEADRTISSRGDSTLTDKSKSYLQILYSDLSSR